jgi:hypothetical protein
MTSTAQATEPTANESLFPASENAATYALQNGVDRCDRCGAEAFVATEITDPTTSKTILLLWCAHHAREHADKISANPNMKVVADRTSVLFAAPKPTI